MSSIFINPFVDVGSGIKPSDGAKLFFFALDVVTPKDTFTTEAATGPRQLIADKLIEASRKAKGISEENAHKAMEQFLKSKLKKP